MRWSLIWWPLLLISATPQELFLHLRTLSHVPLYGCSMSTTADINSRVWAGVRDVDCRINRGECLSTSDLLVSAVILLAADIFSWPHGARTAVHTTRWKTSTAVVDCADTRGYSQVSPEKARRNTEMTISIFCHPWTCYDLGCAQQAWRLSFSLGIFITSTLTNVISEVIRH